jgi:predicted SnoaL-like aldol condensation-catalyzing enzyme
MDTLKINFENLRKDNWTKQETKNVQLVTEFVQLLMNDHDFDTVIKKFRNPYYLQHNRAIPDGMDALVKYVKNFSKKFPDYTYDVKHMYADGDFVIFHSQITTHKKHRGNAKKGFNVHDTWRIENNLIVEHWDSLQPMNVFLRFYYWLVGGKISNSNGVY